MSIFETSSELFDDSDSPSDSTFESASSLSSIESHSDLSDFNSSISSDVRSMSGRTRRSRSGNLLQSSESSSDNPVNSDSTIDSDSTVNQTNSEHSSVASHSHSDMSESEVSYHSSRSSQSSDTEPYDVDEEMARVNEVPVIEINDSQMPNNTHDDDDVILIPQNIETIDLCTQAVVVPQRLRNEVIDITDSPGSEHSRAGPIRRHRSRVSAEPIYVSDNSAPAPQRPTTSTPNARQSTTNTRQQLNLDDSMNDSQPKIALTCPICLDSVVNRTPVSTLCGHIFCQQCIILALGNAKKCPMCKKTLGGKKPFFNIFLPC